MKELNLGAVLKACRVRAGYCQEKMAELMYKSQSDISKIERDQKEPGIKTMLHWAEVTNAKEVVVAYIFGMDGMSIIQNVLPLIGG
ncbi:helix-turn-helix domain-containing protein [Paenibacillus daejeonensis]|uniref:helix-turn-helix domain-containing protein n=1 Tax=Paenibacillus daejeonensis TaxID=135193 RepID=UPI00036C728D|nr:helix-turn-helix transcriptional regulator [Paenibacillus daejeonensis]